MKQENKFIDEKTKGEIKEQNIKIVELLRKHNISVLNYYEIEEILNEHEYNEQQEGYLKEDENYYFDYKKCENYMENNYLNETYEILEQAQDIKELYKKLQELKQEIEEDVYNNFFDFVNKE